MTKCTERILHTFIPGINEPMLNAETEKYWEVVVPWLESGASLHPAQMFFCGVNRSE